MDHPGPTLISHPCLYLSACPISHSFWRSMSCDDPDSTIQGSCSHKWSQDVSCGYLMRGWQLILELLIYYTPMADSLHLCFPLGCSGRLPLVVCHFFLPWSRFAENRIVLMMRDSQGLFIPLVRDSIIIIGSRSVYTFGSCFTYKRWVRVLSKI